MVREGASKTEAVAAVTMDSWHNVIEVALLDRAVYCILAVWCRTPFEVFLIINVSPVEQDIVTARTAVSNYIPTPQKSGVASN